MSHSVKVSATDQQQQILESISGAVELPPVSRSYVVRLVITACAVLLLPVLYLAVLGSTTNHVRSPNDCCC